MVTSGSDGSERSPLNVSWRAGDRVSHICIIVAAVVAGGGLLAMRMVWLILPTIFLHTEDDVF